MGVRRWVNPRGTVGLEEEWGERRIECNWKGRSGVERGGVLSTWKRKTENPVLLPRRNGTRAILDSWQDPGLGSRSPRAATCHRRQLPKLFEVASPQF